VLRILGSNESSMMDEMCIVRIRQHSSLNCLRSIIRVRVLSFQRSKIQQEEIDDMGKQLELLLTKAQLKDQEIEEVTRELDAADKVRGDEIVSNLHAVVLKNEQNV